MKLKISIFTAFILVLLFVRLYPIHADPLGNFTDAQDYSTGYDNSRQVSTNASKLNAVFGYNSGPNQFLQIYDSPTNMPNGSIPLISFRIFGDANFSLNRDAIACTFSHGIFICNSTTATNLTLGSSNCLFYSQFQVTQW